MNHSIAPRIPSRVRLVRVALSLLLALSSTRPAHANPDATLVEVKVIDSSSGLPISHAHVIVESNDATQDGFTDSSGFVSFSGLPKDEYSVTVRGAAYAFKGPQVIRILDARVIRLSFVGFRTRPAVITQVLAKAKSKSQLGDSTDDSATAQIAGSVGSGLTGAVPLNTSPGGDLTLHNHGGQTTAVTIDGAPIFPTGFQTQLSLLGADIFQSAAVEPIGGAGAADGTVGLQTFDPTIDWAGVAQERAASFDGSAFTASERGTTGRVGVSAAYSQSLASDQLQNAYYEDTSGQTYNHVMQDETSGDSLTLRYGFDPDNIGWLDLGSVDLVSPLACRMQSGPLPCGQGPGNDSTDETSFLQYRESLAIDGLSLNVHIFSSRTFQDTNFQNRILYGTPSPITDSQQTTRVGALGDASWAISGNRVARLEFSDINNQASMTGGASPGILLPGQSGATEDVIGTYPLVAARDGGLDISTGVNSVASNTRGVVGVSGNLRPSSDDALSFLYRSGTLNAPEPGVDAIGSGDELAFDCDNHSSLGIGPFGAVGAGASKQYRLSYTHSASALSATVSAYLDDDENALEAGVVPATSLPASFFTSAYIEQANAAGLFACGVPQHLQLPDLFYSAFGQAGSSVYDGVEGLIGFDPSPRSHVDVSYGIEQARAFGLTGPFAGPKSTLVAGSQIPYAPLHRGSLTARLAASKATTMLLALNYLGAANQFTPNALVTVDAGIRFRTENGDLVLAAQNITNAASSRFGAFSPFPTISQPVGPMLISGRYRLALGKENIDRTQYLSAALPATSTLFMIPTPFEPASTSGTWLQPATDRPFCGPEALPAADALFAAIKSYASDVDAARAQKAAMDSFPPRIAGDAELSYVPVADGYVVRVRFPNVMAKDVGPFMRCATIHFGPIDQAKALGLYVPGWRERASSQEIFYARQVGLYAAPAPRDLNANAAVAAGPRESFDVVDSACPATYRSAVADSAKALQSYIYGFYNGTPKPRPTGFDIVSHNAKADHWLEIKAEDRAFGDAVVQCLGVGAVTMDFLERRGLSGAIPPSFNYAPGVGLYTITE